MSRLSLARSFVALAVSEWSYAVEDEKAGMLGSGFRHRKKARMWANKAEVIAWKATLRMRLERVREMRGKTRRKATRFATGASVAAP